MNISKPLVQIIDTIVKFMFLLALFSDNVLCTFIFLFFLFFLGLIVLGVKSTWDLTAFMRSA